MELYRCQSKTDFGVNEVKLYRVNIDSESYFEANSLEIRPGVRIVDIRSLRGHIAIDFDAKDVQLKELILRYLQNTDNVELINILSREYNEYNWFEAYDESYNSNQVYTKKQLLGIQNNEVSAIARTSQIVNPRSFISDVRDKSGHLKPSVLYTYIHEGLPRNQKLDLESLDFAPVWYINGKTNDAKCELFCCFEILIHILAKRFVDFKAKLLKLASTDIQLAKANNQTLERYQHLTQLELIDKIEKLEAKKQGLKKKNKTLEEKLEDINKKFDNFRIESQADRQQLQNSLNEANTKLDASAQREQQLMAQNEHTHQELAQAHAQRDEIQATLNQERDANTIFRNNVNQAIVDIKHQVDERFTQASEFIDNKLTGLNLTTATTAWLFIVIRRPSLIENLRANHTITANQLVLDTVCCKRDDRAKELKRHEYNEDEDEIVLEKPCSNALDLSHFMKRRFEPEVAYCLNKPGQCYRKIVYLIGAEDNVIQQLGLHLATALSVKQEIAQTLDGNQLATRDYIDERFNQLEAQQQLHHQQEMQAINNVGEEVHEIHEIALTIAERLDIQHPDVHEHLHRCRYRLLHREADGRVWCEDLKGGARYYLTEDDINRGHFR